MLKKALRILWCFLRNHYGLNAREFCIIAGLFERCKWCGR